MVTELVTSIELAAATLSKSEVACQRSACGCVHPPLVGTPVTAAYYYLSDRDSFDLYFVDVLSQDLNVNCMHLNIDRPVDNVNIVIAAIACLSMGTSTLREP